MTIIKEKRQFFLGAAIASIVTFLDLLTKQITFNALDKIAFEQSIAFPQIEVTSFFNIAKVWNHGISFGMFNEIANSQLIFSLLQSSIALILAFWLYKNDKRHVTYALGLIIGGAMGNVFDRVKNGAVADFLDFHIAGYHWPAFNLADSCVFIGVAILLLEDLFFKKCKK